MRNLLTLILILSYTSFNYAQLTWSSDVAQIFYNNCTYCHNPNGIAPNSFMTYSETSVYAPLVQTYVQSNIMPPWTADTAYQHYSQERILTQTERDNILNWVANGFPSGDLSQAPAPPVYNGSQILPGAPDLVINAPLYMSKATNFSDDYVCFVIPSGLLQDKKVKAFEVIPGNLETVHHCLVYKDISGNATTDTVGGNCGGPVSGDLMGGYTPGGSPIIFPSTNNFSAGMILESGSDIILAMHYPEGSYGTFDQTKVNIYFYNEPVANFRQIYATPIIQDWSFNIAANTVDTVENSFSGVFNNFTILSVFPHMHLIGKEIESYAVTPASDTIPFIKIPHWDFEWQDFYWFEYMKKIPLGTEIFGRGIYNNTASNEHNPFNPPQNITAGLNTTDEMFLIYFHFMLYQNGDEFINIDSLTNEYLSISDVQIENNNEIKVFPNPFQDETTIEYQINESSFVNASIYDMNGRLIKQFELGKKAPGKHQINWKGENENGQKIASGIYYYSFNINGANYSGKIVLK